MPSCDIPYLEDANSSDFLFEELNNRIQPNKRAHWKNIYKKSGVYVVYHTQLESIVFNYDAGETKTICVKPEILKLKWNKINDKIKTDIIYIGKGNVRNRVRSLIMFGLSLRKNHKGGEWMWQIDDVENLRILISSCPDGNEEAYENWLLEKF